MPIRAPQSRRFDPRDYPAEQRKLVSDLSPFVVDVGNFVSDEIKFRATRDVVLTTPPSAVPGDLATGWVESRAVSYYRDRGRVYLEGVLAGGTYGTDTIFTLPSGFCPAQNQTIAVAQSSLFTPAGVVNIATTGEITAPTVLSVQSGVSTYLSLDGVSFPTSGASVSTGAPFPIAVNVPFEPKQAWVTGCWDVRGDPAPLPTLTWGAVVRANGASGTTNTISVIALDGLEPVAQYTVRLSVLGY